MTVKPIVGLEVHVELSTKSKMFCGCSARHFHVEPNTHTCPVCLGLPGALPVPNQIALEYCIKLGLALNCTIQNHSFFERKNYFYPDLPKGYQISQYQQPLCTHGRFGSIRINRVHMEEDTGKSVHVGNLTLIDYNRSGVPLVEIVSEPDLTSAAAAKQYLLDLQRLIRYLEISDADIEKGSMRCEPTVNIKIDGKPTALVEIKNIASLSGVEAAIDYEISRQTADPDFSGPKTTRGWHPDKTVTFLQRHKEGSSDYRYFPEPDIPPLQFTSKKISAIKSTLPELPEAKIGRYQSDYGLSEYDANLLVADSAIAQTFDSIIQFIKSKTKDIKDFAKFTANILNGVVKNYLNDTGKNVDDLRLGPRFFWETYELLKQNKLSATAAKTVILSSFQTGKDPLSVAQDQNLLQVSDTKKLEEIVQKVIKDNPKAVADYQKNPNSIGFLIGQVMQASGGSANPQLVRQILENHLSL